MNTSQINKALKMIPLCICTFARDQLPKVKKRPIAFVSNTDKACDRGQHWVSIVLLPNGKGEYFDPLGLPPLYPEFITYLKTNCPKGWLYNRTTIQRPDSKSCGPFCILFIKARHKKISYQKFLNKFSSRLSLNEKIIKNGVR